MAHNEVDTSFIPDLPAGGPLEAYRKCDNLDWKRLRLIFENEKALRVKYKVWRRLESDPFFAHPQTTLPIDEQKRICAIQMNRLKHLNLIPEEIDQLSLPAKTKYLMHINEALALYCPSLAVKTALGVGLFNNALRAMGTKKHDKYIDAAWNRDIITCLAVTELSHGSNTKRIRTTATYVPESEEFIINTPDFEAAKCWVGNLGKTATIAMTFANLYTTDGTNHGLHGFLVPIRDPKTLIAYPGVTVGDIGEKCGLNGIDNGFILFKNYRIPRDNFLNRNSDINADGEYESVFTEPGKVLGAALENFSAGRIGITQESANILCSAAVIAVRFAAVRKQFGPDRNGPEMAIIEYQLHQFRIFPYLAAACIEKIAIEELTDIYLDALTLTKTDSNTFDELAETVGEIHAIISATKPWITWCARDAIQEAREACGGHGYLKASNLGNMRNDHDPRVTYEGDNNVLGQQASNWLLRQWSDNTSKTTLGTLHFLKNRDSILCDTYAKVVRRTNGLNNSTFVLSCYEWLLCYLMQSTHAHIERDLANGLSRFDARNNSQVNGARELSLAYAEYFAIGRYISHIEKLNFSPKYTYIVRLLYDINGMWFLEKHMATFYIGGFAKEDNPTNTKSFALAVRECLLNACAEIKNYAVIIADAISPPDFALNSVIAKADGRLYENLQNALVTNEGAFERPHWWREVIIESPPALSSSNDVKSKL